MNIDSSVYDIDVEFGKLNCGDTFIHLTDLYMKVAILHDGITDFLAVRLFDFLNGLCSLEVEPKIL